MKKMSSDRHKGGKPNPTAAGEELDMVYCIYILKKKVICAESTYTERQGLSCKCMAISSWGKYGVFSSRVIHVLKMTF